MISSGLVISKRERVSKYLTYNEYYDIYLISYLVYFFILFRNGGYSPYSILLYLS
jgi:hypothetical protein